MADPDTLIKAKIHYYGREKYYHSMQVNIESVIELISVQFLCEIEGGCGGGDEKVQWRPGV